MCHLYKLIMVIFFLDALASCRHDPFIVIYKYVDKANDAEISAFELKRFFESDSNTICIYKIKSKALNKALNEIKKEAIAKHDTIDNFEDVWYEYVFVTSTNDTIYGLPRAGKWRYKNLRGEFEYAKIKQFLP